MDKKSKKRLEVLRKRLEKEIKLLGFAKQQMDDPSEVADLEKRIEDTKAEIEVLKKS